jgi:hypothetical protein
MEVMFMDIGRNNYSSFFIPHPLPDEGYDEIDQKGKSLIEVSHISRI